MHFIREQPRTAEPSCKALTPPRPSPAQRTSLEARAEGTGVRWSELDPMRENEETVVQAT